jgi:hypothetical protein
VSWLTRGSNPRLWIVGWLVLLIPVWVRGTVGGALMRSWVASTPRMCAKLPSYAEVAPHLPAGSPAPLSFATDATELAGAERLFCAQFQLAPTVVARFRPGALDPRRRDLSGGTASDGAVLVQIDEPEAREAFVRVLAAEVERQGSLVERIELPGGLLLLRMTGR